MMKKNLGPVNALYPSLTTIVGAVVNGKANFLTIAHVGIMNHGTPQYLSFGINKAHYTNQGIIEHKEFSVNIPSETLVVESDYVGLVSGKNTDKSGLFDLFYGSLAHAPLIAACPVVMECRLHSTLDFSTHDVFIGEVMATHVDPEVLNADGKIDIGRVKPLLFDMHTKSYWAIGPEVARCWNVGKSLKKTEPRRKR
jgi:flavin reductase (DIM6/NTAB) family NADH-FMN oxidoreductase RutF